MLARQLLGQPSTPSRLLIQEELRRRVQDCLNRISSLDREVILMRHFENMSNHEVAQTLEISESAASMRYGRAIFRLKETLLEDAGPEDTNP
jgi:RNA polymerase sigma-70 factor (ECF subfamily)